MAALHTDTEGTLRTKTFKNSKLHTWEVLNGQKRETQMVNVYKKLCMSEPVLTDFQPQLCIWRLIPSLKHAQVIDIISST